MDLLGGCLFLFIIACVMCALGVAGVLFLVGTLILLFKMVVWMAYLGAAFIALGLVGLLLAKLMR